MKKEDKELLLGLVPVANKGQELIPHKDYEIKQDGEKFYLVKKKKEYPKTYEECCKVLGIDTQFCMKYLPHGTLSYKDTLIYNLQALLICRDAYWRIAGNEMGLGKPWEPDWKKQDKKYIISVFEDTVIYFENETYNRNTILSFPTAEMRDAFKENFDPDIEICKEFL